MPREIATHKVNPANDQIVIEIVDENPGPGGAFHNYVISHDGGAVGFSPVHLSFQDGPINEVGVNGITHEVLLAVLIDRMHGFQAGPYKCRENALALTKLEEAMHWLHHRTRLRMARGVEGTHTV